MQLFQEKDKGRLSHGGQPSLSSHLPLITSFHRLEGERKKTHTHTHRRGRRKAKLSPAPKNFQHFAGFLCLAGTSSLEQKPGARLVGSATLCNDHSNRGGQGCGQSPAGPCGRSWWPRATWAGMQSGIWGGGHWAGGGQGQCGRWGGWHMGIVAHGDRGTAGPAGLRQTGVPMREGSPWQGRGAVPAGRSPWQGWAGPGWMGTPWHGEEPSAGLGWPGGDGEPRGGVRGAPGPGCRRWMGGRRGR